MNIRVWVWKQFFKRIVIDFFSNMKRYFMEDVCKFKKILEYKDNFQYLIINVLLKDEINLTRYFFKDMEIINI